MLSSGALSIAAFLFLQREYPKIIHGVTTAASRTLKLVRSLTVMLFIFVQRLVHTGWTLPPRIAYQAS